MSTKDYMDKDYYKILGVSKGASADDIKKAFRKIARQNHPDQHPGDAKAESRFKEASEAHTVLSDPQKRKEYDQIRMFSGAGGAFRNFGRGGGAQANAAGFEDIFAQASHMGAEGGLGDLLGGLFSGGRGQTRQQPRQGAEVETKTTISFEQALAGATVSLKRASDEPCSHCQGTGARPGSGSHVCQSCQGSGSTATTKGGVFSSSETCRSCHGRGMLIDDPCLYCHGLGRGQSTHTIQARIPAGVADGQRIRLKGKGLPGSDGGSAGDLYVTVKVMPHETFGREGQDLTVTVPITFVEASFGATVEVPTFESGNVKVKIPAGTPSGRVLRVRGKGSKRSDGTHGDLLVTVDIVLPEAISDQARAALETYAQETADFQPRGI